ncbi:MAG TPA: efflux RND transporter periplasmic adaptor subunit, partial [Candidatus Eisenbacteria bacterium]
MRKRWIFGTLVVALLAAGGWYATRPRTKAPEYRTAVVDRGTIAAQITATGTVKPVTMVQVGSQVSGTIQSLHADFNSTVRKGQVVAQLDPSLFRTQLAQNEANLDRARVNVKDAERTFARSKELLARNLIPQAEVDAAEAAVDRFKAEVSQARATVEQSRVNLEHTTIQSPIDGVVVSRSVDVGQTVAASLSAPVLFEIANDLSAMQVEASIDEADIGQIKAGQPATFTVDAFPDEKFTGVVSQTRLQPITVQNVVTYTTVIAVGNPDLKLRPGMTANVSVETDRREDVLRVPAGALTFKPPDARG